MAQTSKQDEYTLKILGSLQGLFDKDNENYIGLEELNEGNNVTEFMHALATLAPATVYRQVTGEEVDGLGFNHIANRLVFQFSEKE